MPKKIFFYIDYYYPYTGGAEILWQNLAEGLVKKGLKVVVYTNRHNKKLMGEEIRKGVKIYRNLSFGGGVLGRIIWLCFSFWQGLKLVKKEQPDLIQTSTFASSFPAWLISKILKKKVILQVHEFVGKDFLSNEQNKIIALGAYFLEKIQLKFSGDWMMTVSNFSQQRIATVNSKVPIKVVYPGIDYNHWKMRSIDYDLKEKWGFQKTDFLFIFFGRPGFSKGLEFLLSAFKQANFPENIKLVCLVGKEPANRFKYLINKFSFLKNEEKSGEYFSDNIFIKPSVSYQELPNYINLAKAVVIPSLSEGFGFSAVESCVLGKNIVCSQKGSLPEVTFWQVIYFNPLNKKEFIASLNKALKGDFKKIPKKVFTWQKCIDKTLKLYSKILWG